MQLGGENGLEHMVETYQHNMEGNVRQLFVDSFFLSGDEILYIVKEDGLRNYTAGTFLGVPAPPLVLELQCTASQRTTH